jgi:hypothetical protein
VIGVKRNDDFMISMIGYDQFNHNQSVSSVFQSFIKRNADHYDEKADPAVFKLSRSQVLVDDLHFFIYKKVKWYVR